MAEKTVWVVAGNKGGVGKSLFCLALASALEMRGEEFAVLDGDGRAGDVFACFSRKCPARQGDFRNLRPESHTCPFDELYEGMLQQLLRWSPHLIVNTPDGADNIMLGWFDKTLCHTEQNNVVFKLVYLVSDRQDGLEMLDEFASRFQFVYPVKNLYFASADTFAAFNRDYAQKFNVVMELPVLRADECRLLFDQRIYPSEALSLKNGPTGAYRLPMVVRARLSRWQTEVNEWLWDMIDNVDTSTIR